MWFRNVILSEAYGEKEGKRQWEEEKENKKKLHAALGGRRRSERCMEEREVRALPFVYVRVCCVCVCVQAIECVK